MNEKVGMLLMEFVSQKAEIQASFLPILKSRDKDKMLECVIENMVEDIYMIGRIMHAAGQDPTDQLSDMTREHLRALLFLHLRR